MYMCTCTDRDLDQRRITNMAQGQHGRTCLSTDVLSQLPTGKPQDSLHCLRPETDFTGPVSLAEGPAVIFSALSAICVTLSAT